MTASVSHADVTGKRGDRMADQNIITAEKQKIAFNNAVTFLAEMYRKYGDLIVPLTDEEVFAYLRELQKKSAYLRSFSRCASRL